MTCIPQHLCALIFALIACTPTAYGAASFYVNVTGSAATSTGDAGVSDGRSYSSGNLVQTSVSGSTSAGSSGFAFVNGDFMNVHQTASGFVSSTANIGDIHAKAFAIADSGMSTVSSPPNDVGTAQSFSRATASWSDTITLTTDNPAGSDVTLTLGLDDGVSTVGQNFYFEQGTFSAAAQAQLSFSNVYGFDRVQPALVVADYYLIAKNGAVQIAGPHSPASVTLHMQQNVFYSATLTATLTASASVGATGNALADASNTSIFAVSLPDPLAHYTTASGTVFATAVPDPTNALALLGLPLALALRPRRQ